MDDRLKEIFEMQRKLNKRIGVDTDKMNDDDRAEWVLNYSRALGQKFDKQNAKVEVADMFHFLISLAQVLELTAEDVYQAYVKKNKLNFERQESGYATKDEGDNLSI
jgi:dimeric dUTPase (all-alpha-NTP-PPase superfamily)